MKKIIVLPLIFLLLSLNQARGYQLYDFYSYASSGQKIYYKIISQNERTVKIVHPNSSNTSGWDGYARPTGDIVLPGQVVGPNGTYTVIQIATTAFMDCTGITSVTFPNTIQEINANAFTNCTQITEITLPNSLKVLWDWAFENTGISTVQIPSSVVRIPGNPFSACNNLQSVTVASGNTHYKSVGGLLYSYNNDTLFTFPCQKTPYNGIVEESDFIYNPTVIKERVFYNNNRVVKITLPSNLIISYSLIKNCQNLQEITFGPNITYIGGTEGLYNLPSLEQITVHAIEPPSFRYYVGENFHYINIDSNVAVSVPCGSIEAYRNAFGWEHFHNMTEFGISFSAVSANSSWGTVSVITEPTCQNRNATVKANPYNGYEFDHWSNGSTSNPYSLYVNEDMTLVGYFKPKSNPTDVFVVTSGGVDAYSGNRSIIIKSDEKQMVQIFDLMGYCVFKGAVIGETDAEISSTGLYIVCFQNGYRKKIVVK